MEKLSIYELLSYIVPGFLAIYIYNVYAENIFNCGILFNGDQNLNDSLMLLCLSLFIGIVIHIITFGLINFKWIKKLIYKSPQQSSTDNEFIQRIIPFLNKEYERIRKHNEDAEVIDNKGRHEAEEYLFDFAYLYLETNDKIAPAKSFQSLYFWVRNMFTICVLLFPFSIFVLIYTTIKPSNHGETKHALCIIIINVIFFCIIIPVARWLREKLMEKVFWSYYVERVHELDKPTNNL